MLDGVAEYPKCVFLLHNFCSFVCLVRFLSITWSSRLLIHSFASSSLPFIQFSIFLISFIVDFISDWFFSISLLKVFLMSSTLFSSSVSIFRLLLSVPCQGYYLSLFLLGLLLWLVFSFGTYSSISPFCLARCLSFLLLLLGKKAKSSELESNGLMKKSSCSVLLGSFPCSPEPVPSGVSFIYDVCTLPL